MLAYRLAIVRDEDGSFLVTSPDFPELTSFGETESEAALHGTRALEEAVAARIDDRRELPPPIRDPRDGSRLAPLPTLVALKVSLYRLIGERGVTRADLARRLAWPAEHVDRLLRLDEPAPIDELESAFRVLGSEIDFQVRPAVAA